jgi:hypothetical protein
MSNGLIIYCLLKFQFHIFYQHISWINLYGHCRCIVSGQLYFGKRHEQLLLSLPHKNIFDFSSGGTDRKVRSVGVPDQ